MSRHSFKHWGFRVPIQRILEKRRALPAAIVAVLAVQAFLPSPRGSLFWSTVYDVGHAPLYGLVALLLLRILPAQNRIRSYAASFLGTALIGVVVEAAQYFGPRDADAMDIAWNLLGSASALFLAVGCRESRRSLRVPALAVGLLLALLAASPLLSLASVYARRDAAFPVLCDFGPTWERKLIALKDAELALATRPEGWPALDAGMGVSRTNRKPADQVGRVTFHPAPYPGMALLEVHPDWSGYGALRVDVWSELPESVRLFIRIDDRQHNEEYADRFNGSVVIAPGANPLEIPLDAVRQSPRDREMDMRAIRTVVLFAAAPTEPFSLYFDHIRLESPMARSRAG